MFAQGRSMAIQHLIYSPFTTLVAAICLQVQTANPLQQVSPLFNLRVWTWEHAID